MIELIFSGTSSLHEYEQLSYEWLDTNGLGGWASASLTGCNSRRYHGLLISPTQPQMERMVLVSKLDETIISDHKRYELAVNNYGDVVAPKGYQYLHAFSKDLYPTFTYQAGDIRLQKSVLMIHGENTTIIKYDILQSDHVFQLELLPLLAVRDIHQLKKANNEVKKEASFTDGVFKVNLYDNTPDVFIQLEGGLFHPHPDWYLNFNFEEEKARGLEYKEDLYTPGKFSIEVKQGDSVFIMLSTEDVTGRDAAALFSKEVKRRQQLIEKSVSSEVLKQLTLAADQFIVNKDKDLKTIIAGYHWFTNWSRDTMISLPGLCLSTGRFDDAKKILAVFAKSVNKGMLPNRFSEKGGKPEYNNVDGTLWFFYAIHKYFEATGDKEFVLKDLLPVLIDIIDHHYLGTRFNIHVDDDELLFAGEPGVQLTWMDVKIGDRVITPRTGKPVEVQALWYNALCIFSDLLYLNKQVRSANFMKAKAQKVKDSFLSKFWYQEGGYLYDVIDAYGQPDASLRPNQLLAISLPFPLLEGEKSISVLTTVERKLYTPYGLLTLAPDEEQYIPHYTGDQHQRDAAYHQGAVWSWLLGPYIDAIMKEQAFTGMERLSGKRLAQNIISKFLPHLMEGSIGTISEIFDAEAPHHFKGCAAQAWSVGELLRIIKEYNITAIDQHFNATSDSKKVGVMS